MAWSLLIRGGTVVDGSGAPARAADVAVEGERIAAVGPGLAGEAARVIDATGQMVAPGFIDMHSHSDLFYVDCPSAESKIRQGVTTEVVGMCSFSPAPLRPGPRRHRAGLGGRHRRPDPIAWETFGSTSTPCAALGPSVNIAQFVGHGALRLAAMGLEARPADARRAEGHAAPARRGDGRRRLRLLHRPRLRAERLRRHRGADRAGPVHGRARRLYFSHIRGEAATLEQAVDEAIRIGEEGGVAVQIAHVKASGRENWGKMDRVLRLFDGARARGVDVTGDVYPYNAGSTKMDNLMPALGARRRHLASCSSAWPTRRRGGAHRRNAWSTASAGARSPRAASASTRSSSPPAKPELEGLNLAELARQTGKAPAEALMDLLLEESAASAW